MKKTVLYFILTILVSCDSSQKEKVSEFNSKKYDIEYNDNRVFFKCRVNDTIAGNFLFDTGCYGIYYDSIFNFQHKLINYGNSFLLARNDSLPGKPLPKQRLSFSDCTYSAYETLLANLKSMDGKHIDGMIGWDLFDGKMIEFNFLDEFVKIYDPKDTIMDPSFTKIPLQKTEDGFLINTEININGNLKIAGDFILDMGCTGEIVLNHTTVEQYQLKEKIKDALHSFTKHGNLLGKTSLSRFRAKSMLVGNFILADPVIAYSDQDDGVLEGRSFIGLIGMKTLERFDMIIDFKRNVLYLRPNSNFNNEFNYISAGLTFVDRTDVSEGWEINTILLNEQADQTGVKPGDVITHINNKDVKTLSCDSVIQSFKIAGNNVELIIKRGKISKKVVLQAKEYFKK